MNNNIIKIAIVVVVAISLGLGVGIITKNISSSRSSNQENLSNEKNYNPLSLDFWKNIPKLLTNNNKTETNTSSDQQNFFYTAYWNSVEGATLNDHGKGITILNNFYLQAQPTSMTLEDPESKMNVEGSSFSVSFNNQVTVPTPDESIQIVEEKNIQHADDGFGIKFFDLKTDDGGLAEIKVRFISFIKGIEISFSQKDKDGILVYSDQVVIRRIVLPEFVNISVDSNDQTVTVYDSTRNKQLTKQKLPFKLLPKIGSVRIAFQYNNFVEKLTIDNFIIQK